MEYCVICKALLDDPVLFCDDCKGIKDFRRNLRLNNLNKYLQQINKGPSYPWYYRLLKPLGLV